MDDELPELVRRARAHDPDAWESLYRRLHRPLLAYAARRLASRHDAEEAVSETMARAVDALERYTEDGTGVDAWFYGILRNVVRERWRQQARDRALPERVPAEVEDAGPAEVLLEREQRSELLCAFAHLSAEDQETLELRLVQELSAEQVAAVQGRGAGAVRMAQSRALTRLRTILRTEANR